MKRKAKAKPARRRRARRVSYGSRVRMLGRFVQWRQSRGRYVGVGNSGTLYTMIPVVKYGARWNKSLRWEVRDPSDKLIGRYETTGLAMEAIDIVEGKRVTRIKRKAA
jgi:hypothetical protein